MLLLNILICSLTMWLAIWLMCRSNSVNLKPVIFISLGVAVGSVALVEYLGVWGVPLTMAGLIFSLMHFCFLSWPKAIVVALVWLATMTIFGIFFGRIL